MSVSRGNCPRCLRRVLEGQTERGFDVRLDPTELDALGELAVTVAGGVTYTRHRGDDSMHHRGAYEIRTRPAGSRPRQAVHAAHDCARPTPPPSDRKYPDRGGGVPASDDPPF